MDNNLKNLEKTFNKELAKVSRWLIANNKLTLNISKSNFVIFRPYQKQITYQPTFKLFDNNSQLLVALECKTYIEYLGVSINQHLSWKLSIILITSLKESVKLLEILQDAVIMSLFYTL